MRCDHLIAFTPDTITWHGREITIGKWYVYISCKFRLHSDSTLFKHCPNCGTRIKWKYIKEVKQWIKKRFLKYL